MPDQSLNILVVYPDAGPTWPAKEPVIRERLAGHKVTSVAGLANAEPHLADVDVVLSFTFRDDFAAMAPKLRWIQGFGAGVESFANLPAIRPDILLTNMRGIHGDAVSECAVALLFALSRQLPRNVIEQQAHRWTPFDSQLLTGRTLGILGVGAISEALAQRAKGLGMRTVGISGRTDPAPHFDEMRARGALPGALADIDYLVLLAPLTAESQGMVDAAFLAAMKPGAFIVNVARGGLIDEPALIDALERGHIAGAALDTVVGEPPAADNPLWDAPNVILTPHNAGRHEGYVRDAMDIFTQNIAHFLSGDHARMINRL